ncbi:hypothetical protein ACFYM2_10600 [Streptomyces sp. NPDC006711]|uniref:hypothetical protein n=1 Tax=unclassified Streptomyces TaxID=2593676 RepID=UPI0033DAF8DC
MHRFSRTTGLATVGLTAVLLLSGCGSGGSDAASNKPSGGPSGSASGAAAASATPTAGATSGAAAPGGTGASTPGGGKGHGPASQASPATANGLDGNWVAVTRGKPVALVIKGRTASVLGEHQCTGTADGKPAAVTLRLTCTDGDTTRTRGTAKVNGAHLEVSWAGFGKDEFTRNKTSH